MKTRNLLLVLAFFAAEVPVATLFAKFGFVRGYLGDFLVVILLYFLIKLFREVRPLQLAMGIFVFACGVEVTQYFHLADLLGFHRGSLINILLGDSFSWVDIITYFLGCVTSYLIDKVLHYHTGLTATRKERGLG